LWASLKASGIRADKIGSKQSVPHMAEVIQVTIGEVHYSANVQGVLSKRIQGKLDQLYPERWNRADRIAAQAIADMKSFDKRIAFSLNVERPVAADGTFSEKAFAQATEKLKAEVHALVHEMRKAAHLAIASTAYSTVIHVAAPEDMLTNAAPGSR
jgi:hypothetical protein